jgi:hypothetical protein
MSAEAGFATFGQGLFTSFTRLYLHVECSNLALAMGWHASIAALQDLATSKTLKSVKYYERATG